MPEVDNTIIAQRVEPVKQASVEPQLERKPSEPSIVTHEYIEKPPSLEENFYNKMFELGEAAGHFEMKTLTKEINEYVLSQTEDTSESYKEFVEKYLARLHLPENIDVYTKTEKIHELMMIDAKLLRLAKEKEELLAKPINELNSVQLRKRIEGKL